MITVSRRKIPISPQKLRRIVDKIRQKPVDQAEIIIDNLNLAGSGEMKKLLRAGIDAAVQNNLEREKLFISEIKVNEGPKLKRFRPSARGRSNRYLHRRSHLSLSLAPTDKKPSPKSIHEPKS